MHYVHRISMGALMCFSNFHGCLRAMLCFRSSWVLRHHLLMGLFFQEFRCGHHDEFSKHYVACHCGDEIFMGAGIFRELSIELLASCSCHLDGVETLVYPPSYHSPSYHSPSSSCTKLPPHGGGVSHGCVELGQNLIFWSGSVLSESDVLSYQNLMKFPTVGKLALPHFAD